MSGPIRESEARATTSNSGSSDITKKDLCNTLGDLRSSICLASNNAASLIQGGKGHQDLVKALGDATDQMEQLRSEVNVLLG